MLAAQVLTEVAYPPHRAERVLALIQEHSTRTCGEILRVFTLSHQMGRPLAEAVTWYRGKIDVAMSNIQTPEGRAMAESKLPPVETFLSALEHDLRELPAAQ